MSSTCVVIRSETDVLVPAKLQASVCDRRMPESGTEAVDFFQVSLLEKVSRPFVHILCQFPKLSAELKKIFEGN